MLNATEIRKAYSRLFPMAAFKEEDWPLRKIVIDLCCEEKIGLNECGRLLNSIKSYHVVWGENSTD